MAKTKWIVPAIALVICAASLVGAAYAAYTATLTDNESVTADNNYVEMGLGSRTLSNSVDIFYDSMVGAGRLLYPEPGEAKIPHHHGGFYGAVPPAVQHRPRAWAHPDEPRARGVFRSGKGHPLSTSGGQRQYVRLGASHAEDVVAAVWIPYAGTDRGGLPGLPGDGLYPGKGNGMGLRKERGPCRRWRKF